MPLNLLEVTQYVEDNIGDFHKRRIEGVSKLNLKKVIKAKNPYLFKAKNVLTAGEIVKTITDAYLSSQEEAIFGNWLEDLAIFINSRVYGGWKSGIPNIDLEFDKDRIRYIVSIKSGPKWGNSSQVKKMKSDFQTAKRTLRTGNSGLNIVAVNGCCYGQEATIDRGDYFKYCGQIFWEFVSGDPDLYINLIEPIGHDAAERNDEYMEAYANAINQLTLSFIQNYCNDDGSIDWPKIVEINSKKRDGQNPV